MLKDIDALRVPIKLGGENLYLRYNLNAMRYLEEYYGDTAAILDKDSDSWTVDDTCHILRAGLMDYYFADNEDAISRREFDRVRPSMAGIGRMVDTAGVAAITTLIIEALLQAYPPVPQGADATFLPAAGGTAAN